MKSCKKTIAGLLAVSALVLGLAGCSHSADDNGTSGGDTTPAGFVRIAGTDVGTFYIAKTELTYEKWYEVYQWATSDERGVNKYVFQNSGKEGNAGTDGAEPTAKSNHPVTSVSWRDVIVWCNAASEKEGLTPIYEFDGVSVRESESTSVTGGQGKAEKATVKAGANGYRLPTEAEWEYAAKGGQDFTYSGSDNIDDVAWYTDNCAVEGVKGTHAVGTLNANGYGAKDMSGNVWEWCWDPYSSGSSYRVLRGGSWAGGANLCTFTSSGRDYGIPAGQSYNRGFRVARNAN